MTMRHECLICQHLHHIEQEGICLERTTPRYIMKGQRLRAQTRGRSASPSPTNRHTLTRQRSPLPSSSGSSQDTIEPSDSISQTSQRVPDVMKKTWKKKSRTGVRSTFSDVYEYFETVNEDGVW